MGRKQNPLLGSIAGICLLVLIFDSTLALEGARSGIELCVQTVIPSLFPFFVLSMVLTNSQGEHISGPVRYLSGFLGIPQSAAAVLIPSVLGGYPVGAKCIGDLYHTGKISRREAERLLSFCSNAGPSFLFGMVSGFFPDRKMIWMLWFIHLLSAALTGLTFPPESIHPQIPYHQSKTEEKNVILSAATAMCAVCCWVILFRTFIAFLDDWFLRILPGWSQVLFAGILELTNGCCELMRIPDVKLRFVVCSCMIAFGGICVLFQTAAVTDGLSIKCYIKGKLLQTVFSFLASCALISDKGMVLGIFVPIFIMILRKIQKRYGNPGPLPV